MASEFAQSGGYGDFLREIKAPIAGAANRGLPATGRESAEVPGCHGKAAGRGHAGRACCVFTDEKGGAPCLTN